MDQNRISHKCEKLPGQKPGIVVCINISKHIGEERIISAENLPPRYSTKKPIDSFPYAAMPLEPIYGRMDGYVKRLRQLERTSLFPQILPDAPGSAPHRAFCDNTEKNPMSLGGFSAPKTFALAFVSFAATVHFFMSFVPLAALGGSL